MHKQKKIKITGENRRTRIFFMNIYFISIK